MEYLWIFLVAFYGLSKGVRDGFKKLAMQKSTLMEVLLLHSLITFLLTIPISKDPFQIPPVFYILIFIKSFAIFLAWIFSFKALAKMPLSYFGVIDMSRVVFSTLMGVLILGETMNPSNILGLALVLLGLFLVNIQKSPISHDGVSKKYLILALISCLLNGISGTMDKIYTHYITPGQLQFWYMFFMVVLYGVYVLAKKEKVRLSALKTNPYIIIMSVLFVLADRALFIGNSMPQSQVTIMTLIKQSSIIVTILFGKFIFKEKNILHRFLCSLLIISGIMIALIWS